MNRFSQYCVFPIVWFFSKLFLKVEFRNPDRLDQVVGKPAIIIANHVSYFDSFLLRLTPKSVGLSVYFMGVKSFHSANLRFLYNIGIIPFVYYLFGVFMVTPGLGIDKNLEIPKKLLSKNNQVFIFPEGSVNHSNNGNLNPFKKGAATLAHDTGVAVLPISYKLKDVKHQVKTIIITVGEVMNFSKDQSVEQINLAMQDKIKEMLVVS